MGYRPALEQLESRNLLATVTLFPVADNTLYESSAGNLSNGSGNGLFAGRTGQTADSIRRALLQFDVSSSVPANSTIDSVTLNLQVTRNIAPESAFSLHNVLADWGEGTTVASGQEGGGGVATVNSATWLHRFFSQSTWTTPGGDFTAAASATTMVNGQGSYSWSGSGLVADVQSWLDDPANDFGWLLKSTSEPAGSAKRFASKEHPNQSFRPQLVIEYSESINKSPTLDPISNPPAVLEDASQQTVNLTGISAGQGENQTITVSAVSSNPALIPNPTVDYSSPNSTGSLRYTPIANQFGSAVITVSVRDNGGTTNGGVDLITRSFTVTVTGVNDVPTLDAIANPPAVLEDAALQTVNLSGISAGQGESQTLVITATSNNPSLIPDPTVLYTSPNLTGSLSYAPIANQFGSATITVLVRDDGGTANGGSNQFSRTFDITITPVNDDPTLDAIANPTAILEDSGQQTIGLTGIAAGANENQTLTVTAVSSNPGLIPDPAVVYTSSQQTGSLVYSPMPDAFGTAVIFVTVADDGGTANGGSDSVTQSFTVTVDPVNDAPSMSAINDLTVLEDASEQTLSVSDILAGVGESQTLTLTASSNNTALIPPPTVDYSSPLSAGTIKLTPAPDQSGTAVITVTLSDSGGTANGGNDQFVQTFTVTVNPVNDAPQLDSIESPNPIDEDSQVQQIELTGISAGANESQSLTIVANSSDTALIPDPSITYTSPNDTASLSFSPLPNAFGTATITVTLMDDGGTIDGGSDTIVRTFSVTINPVNDAPTLDAVSSPDPILEDATTQSLMLSGITAGPLESQPLRITAESSNPALVVNPEITYTSPMEDAMLSYLPVANAFGTAVITLTVEDAGNDGDFATAGDNASTARQFTITVEPVNDLPTLDAIATRQLDIDAPEQMVDLSGISAGAAESQPLRITASSSNSQLIANPIINYSSPEPTGRLVFTPSAGQTGTSLITVTVEDGGLDQDLSTEADNASFQRTFSVFVGVDNAPPTLDAISDAVVDEDSPQQTIVLSGISAGGIEEQMLRVAVTANNGTLFSSLVTDYSSPSSFGELRFAPAPNQFGNAILIVTVEDAGPDDNFATPSDNASVSQTFTVTVSPENDAPIAQADSITVQSDVDSVLELLQNDQDIDSSLDVASIEFRDGPSHGNLTLDVQGNVHYLPQQSYFGQDTFSYRIADVEGAFSDWSEVSLLINARPLANNDQKYISSDGTTSVQVVANDQDPDGDVQDLVVEIVTQLDTNVGTVTVANSQVVEFDPGASFDGSVVIEYVIRDLNGGISASATILIGVYNQNPVLPLDVNQDTFVTPLDVLIIVNTLNNVSQGARALVPGLNSAPFYDVNADGFVAPIDVLQLVNFLNSQANGEGEFTDSSYSSRGFSDPAAMWLSAPLPTKGGAEEHDRDALPATYRSSPGSILPLTARARRQRFNDWNVDSNEIHFEWNPRRMDRWEPQQEDRDGIFADVDSLLDSL
ncbi:MAG: tandem-95 repeat protein [Planctomycetales bacterium]|nr:tandem-95 repeat protein [Planctomycetales bacterium]